MDWFLPDRNSGVSLSVVYCRSLFRRTSKRGNHKSFDSFPEGWSSRNDSPSALHDCPRITRHSRYGGTVRSGNCIEIGMRHAPCAMCHVSRVFGRFCFAAFWPEPLNVCWSLLLFARCCASIYVVRSKNQIRNTFGWLHRLNSHAEWYQTKINRPSGTGTGSASANQRISESANQRR